MVRMGRGGHRGASGAGRAERIDLQLGRFASDGSIVAELAGRRVAVEGGIPTETARVALHGAGSRWRGDVVAVLDPAPERVAPRCPVVDRCGGCEWQHLDHAGQLKHKAAIVRRLLAGQRLQARLDAVVPMPDPWHYRVRAQIALAESAGFRERRAKRVVRLTACPVVHPLIDRLLEQVNRLIKLGEIPDYRGRLLVHAQVVGPAVERRLQLLLETVDGLALDEAPGLAETAAALAGQRGVESVALREPDGGVQALHGDLFSEVEIGGLSYTLPAGAFFQSNLQLLPDLLARVRRLVDLSGGEEVADLYGGVGVFGLALSDAAAHVTVIEIEPVASEAGRLTAAKWGRTNVDFVAAPAEEAVVDLPRLDRVVVDPPRTGLDRRVVDALAERAPEAIVYVSCNPATFARDAAAFVRAGYSIEHLSLLDFYPQTVHVEVVARLSRPG
ncbi:MAG TPA: 23S rRNA (uracil(1939)-C(5))-methyltransferase RlmD [Thermomicrobiaceae bacterium]|nr:23S rRNA (uracil(1939)-C(5))-methyltransferase RlmD [Thermomicrobiaceae bacterium]